MELASSPDPCMPMPIMPKRTRSLGATVCGKAQSGSGSSKMVFSRQRRAGRGRAESDEFTTRETVPDHEASKSVIVVGLQASANPDD